MKNKTPVGITVFGLYYIVGAVSLLLCKLANPYYYSWYNGLFHPLADKAIFLRYVFSLAYRVFELIAGVGILLQKENFRKLILLLNWFTICILYWKHPFYAVEKHAENVIENLRETIRFDVLAHISIIKFTWIVLAGLYGLDIGIAAATIYYFSRPYIKARFK